MTTQTAPRDGLDRRVTDPDTGQPVAKYRFTRGWFTIIRAAGTTGVNLQTRIPGYLTEVTPHPTQDAAERAARAIYAQYRIDVRAPSDQSEDPNNQED